MYKKWLCFTFIVILLGFIQSFALEQRPMTIDDALNIVSVRNSLLSPDGRHVFYSLEKLDWGKNKHINTYYWFF